MTNNFYYIHIASIIIILIYIVSIKYFLRYKDTNVVIEKIILNNEIEYNLKNKKILKKQLFNIIEERLKLLKNVSYDEWIDYNRKNKIIKINNNHYYLFIYESTTTTTKIETNKINGLITKPDNFINKVCYDNNFENLSFDSISNIINNSLKIGTYNLDQKLISNIYHSSNNYTENAFFWTNKLFDKDYHQKNGIVEYNSFSMKYNKNNISGIIGISYPINDILKNITYKYYNIINKKILILIVLFMFIISYILNYININKNIVIPILFLVITNLYIIFYCNQSAELGNYEYLVNTFNEINTSTLSIAFLISANTFILTYVHNKGDKQNINIYYSNIFIFCVSLFLLLSSLYKNTSIFYNYSLREIYIVKELLFNLVIIVNFMILIIYIYHINFFYLKKII